MRLLVVLSLVLLISTALLLFQFVTGSLIGADEEPARPWSGRARRAHYRSSTSSVARAASRRRATAASSLLVRPRAHMLVRAGLVSRRDPPREGSPLYHAHA